MKACAVEIDKLRLALTDFLDHELSGLVVDGVVGSKRDADIGGPVAPTDVTGVPVKTTGAYPVKEAAAAAKAGHTIVARWEGDPTAISSG